MLGYKVYFNKDIKRFDYDTNVSEAQYPLPDGTSFWFDELRHAISVCNSYNIALDRKRVEVKTCKDCGELFILTRSEKDWLKNNNLKPYARCFSCRKKRREK